MDQLGRYALVSRIELPYVKVKKQTRLNDPLVLEGTESIETISKWSNHSTDSILVHSSGSRDSLQIQLHI